MTSTSPSRLDTWARHRAFGVMAAAWWLLWRAPFWRAWIDFYDSVQFVGRVAAGPLAGFHAVNAHLPLQSTVYGPAALLHAALQGGFPPEVSITLVTTVYGAAAFWAALSVCRRFFAPSVVVLSALLYPLLAGIGLADLTTYSMSALHAFLWGGTALLASGLSRPHGNGMMPRLIGAALLFAFAVYTHILAVLWATVPGVVVAAFLAGSPLLVPGSETPLVGRVRIVVWRVLMPTSLMVAALLLVEGWQASQVGLADDPMHGVMRLLFRDMGGERWFQAELRLVAVVISGPGMLALVVGIPRWVKGQGAWSAVAAAGLVMSAVVCGYQFHWGFMGRLWFPCVLWAVPVIALVAQPGSGRLGALMFIPVVLQNLFTFVHVHATRVAGPHPPMEERRISSTFDATRDIHVLARREAGFTMMPPARKLEWERAPDASSLDERWFNNPAFDGQVWVSSMALKSPYQLRDGHLVAVDNSAAPREPTSLEKYVLERGLTLVLDAPTGRGEFISRLMRPERAPTWQARVALAMRHLSNGQALLLVNRHAEKPLFVTVHSTSLSDCVLQEAYDAWDLESWYAIARVGCRPLATGTTDGLGILFRPLPDRDAYRVTLTGAADDHAVAVLHATAWEDVAMDSLSNDIDANTVLLVRPQDGHPTRCWLAVPKWPEE